MGNDLKRLEAAVGGIEQQLVTIRTRLLELEADIARAELATNAWHPPATWRERWQWLLGR